MYFSWSLISWVLYLDPSSDGQRSTLKALLPSLLARQRVGSHIRCPQLQQSEASSYKPQKSHPITSPVFFSLAKCSSWAVSQKYMWNITSGGYEGVIKWRIDEQVTRKPRAMATPLHSGIKKDIKTAGSLRFSRADGCYISPWRCEFKSRSCSIMFSSTPFLSIYFLLHSALQTPVMWLK